MSKKICRNIMTCLFATLMLAGTTGCSVFVSTPNVASYHIQRMDDRLVEMVVHLESPTESDISIHLKNRYTLQFEFDWLFDKEHSQEAYMESDNDFLSPSVTPWVVCKYRF